LPLSWLMGLTVSSFVHDANIATRAKATIMNLNFVVFIVFYPFSCRVQLLWRWAQNVRFYIKKVSLRC